MVGSAACRGHPRGQGRLPAVEHWVQGPRDVARAAAVTVGSLCPTPRPAGAAAGCRLRSVPNKPTLIRLLISLPCIYLF